MRERRISAGAVNADHHGEHSAVFAEQAAEFESGRGLQAVFVAVPAADRFAAVRFGAGGVNPRFAGFGDFRLFGSSFCRPAGHYKIPSSAAELCASG